MILQPKIRFAGAIAFALVANTGIAQVSAPPAAATASAPGSPATAVAEPKALGEEHYAIGRIVIDKRKGSFVVPGRVNVIDQPLEYLASTPGGMKAYETLVTLDATGSELNLACILIGLERDPDLKPFRKGGTTPVTGPRVTVTLGWTKDGKRTEMSAAEAIGAAASAVEWVYTGSPVSQAASFFAADRTGTLIGFVHDPATLIEAANSIGIGAYGSIRGNPALPPAGTAIELTIAAVPRKP